MTPANNSPQTRLAVSRKALVRQMARGDGRMRDDAQNASGSSAHGHRDDAHANTDRSSIWQVFTEALSAWWQHHPAQVAIDIGRPFLNNYAREKPLQLLGVAAGLGAAVVLVKPWRLVSFTSLAVATLKSTKLSTTLLSLLSRTQRRATQEPEPSDKYHTRYTQ